MKNNSWKILSSKIVYQNDFNRSIKEYKVLKSDGKEGTFAVFEVPPAVYIIALTPENEVYLINHYRFPIKDYSLELPAGGTDGEEFLKAAQRELMEETGLEAKKWTELGKFQHSTGSSNELGIVFLAEDLTQNEFDLEADIEEIVKIKIEDVLEMIKKGKIIDSSTMTSFLIAADYLNIGVTK